MTALIGKKRQRGGNGVAKVQMATEEALSRDGEAQQNKLSSRGFLVGTAQGGYIEAACNPYSNP
jgi:hypothetical protein